MKDWMKKARTRIAALGDSAITGLSDYVINTRTVLPTGPVALLVIFLIPFLPFAIHHGALMYEQHPIEKQEALNLLEAGMILVFFYFLLVFGLRVKSNRFNTSGDPMIGIGQIKPMDFEMDEKIAVERLVQQVKDYANGRAKDVARGAETPRLAALLVQKYGRGVVDAAATIFERPRAAEPILKAVDDEASKIDPLWREHDKDRWAGRPADVVAHRGCEDEAHEAGHD